MSNLSELLPAGGAAKEFEPTASGSLSSGQAVILNSNGTVSAVTGSSASMGTADNTAGVRNSGYAGACYHITNNSTVVAFVDGLNNGYTTTAVCTLSGTTVTMNTPVVVDSNAASFVRCAYDVTQNKVVFYYRKSSVGYVKAATVTGNSFSFGSQVTAFSGATLGNRPGDMCNLDDSKVVIGWGSGASDGTAGAQVVSISGTTLTVGTRASVATIDSYGMMMASGKKGEFLCLLGGTARLGYAAATVSGTTITKGALTTVSGAAYNNHLASGFWNGYPSVESTYIAAYHVPGGAAGVTNARVITVSGNTLTLHAELSLNADAASNFPGMGWGSSINEAVFYYRPQSDSSSGRAVPLSYSGTTVTEGAITSVGAGNYHQWGVTCDHVAKRSIAIYQSSSNSDLAEVNVYIPETTTNTDFVGFTADAIASGASGVVNPEGGVATNFSSLTIGSEYYVQGNGTISTASASPAVNIGKALSTTSILLKG
jgi:hypothetical protein